MKPILTKYAQLLINYCLEIKKDDRLLINSTYLAEPLLKEVYKAALEAGGHPYLNVAIQDTDKVFYDVAEEHQLTYNNEFTLHAMKEFEAYLAIRAPFNLRSLNTVDPKKQKLAAEASSAINKIYFERTATRDLKRNLCQYPTAASAQEAGMSLQEYEEFVFGACNLFSDDPQEEWLSVRESQQHLVDYLSGKSQVRYVTKDTDITYSTKGRTWINSDGQTNMPSGEVYTAPVDDSVNGHITFSYPAIYRGQSVEGVRLEVKDGFIEKWSAESGQEVLDEVFQIEGTRRFGEAAIGTNYNIQKVTKNILFDEKIGGSIHMAIGQAYKQCGGVNQSPVHWDMITDMKAGGQIFADGELFYENGKVLI